jgi:hypothetical protein
MWDESRHVMNARWDIDLVYWSFWIWPKTGNGVRITDHGLRHLLKQASSDTTCRLFVVRCSLFVVRLYFSSEENGVQHEINGTRYTIYIVSSHVGIDTVLPPYPKPTSARCPEMPCVSYRH